MVNQKKKGKYIGMAGALVVHIAIIALLILVGFTRPEPSEEGVCLLCWEKCPMHSVLPILLW